jgi:hypothetical protein
MTTISNFPANLTNGGNLLINFNNDFHFIKPCGEYIRMVGFEEAEYLQSICTKITIISEIKTPSVSKWKFLFSTQDIDNSDYYWAHSNNGGKYSVTDTHNFFSRLNGDRLEFLRLTETQSSGEFSQTWDGKYQNRLNDIFLIDVEGGWRLVEQCDEDCQGSIQSFGQMVSWKELFEGSREITSNYEQKYGQYKGNSETIETPINFSDYVSRWRKISEITGKMPYEIANVEWISKTHRRNRYRSDKKTSAERRGGRR